MKLRSFESKLILLSIITNIIWVTNIPWQVVTFLYIITFALFYYQKRPYTWYLVVVFFSIISKNIKEIPNYEYTLIVILSIIRK